MCACCVCAWTHSRYMRAGTMWIHPHVHGSSALQVGGGSSALALILEDDVDDDTDDNGGGN